MEEEVDTFVERLNEARSKPKEEKIDKLKNLKEDMMDFNLDVKDHSTNVRVSDGPYCD